MTSLWRPKRNVINKSILIVDFNSMKSLSQQFNNFLLYHITILLYHDSRIDDFIEPIGSDSIGFDYNLNR